MADERVGWIRPNKRYFVLAAPRRASSGMASAQRCCRLKTNFRCADVAPESTGDAVGLSGPVERFLASAGGSNGGWDGRKLQMTRDVCDHRFLGDRSNDPV
jgi:hypothetical protein